MSEARLWPCELTAGALAAVKEALEAANAAVGAGPKVEVTYRLYQRAEGGRPILLGRMASEPRRCYVSADGRDGGEGGKDGAGGTSGTGGMSGMSGTGGMSGMSGMSGTGGTGGYFIVSPEVEALITKLHGGTMKLRQTLSYEGQRANLEAGTIVVGAVSINGSTIGVLVVMQSNQQERARKVLDMLLPRRIFPELAVRQSVASTDLMVVVGDTLRTLL